MGNRVHIQKTIFQNIDDDGNITSESYGIRISDDELSDYTNLIESKDELIEMNDADTLDLARSISNEASQLIRYAIDEDVPLYINDRRYKP